MQRSSLQRSRGRSRWRAPHDPEGLTVEQYRGFASRTPIEFDPSFTLIVGENGVGKTSVLWALRVLLSHMLARLVKKPAKSLLFQPEDIARGWPYLRAEVAVGLDPGGTTATCIAQKNASQVRAKHR